MPPGAESQWERLEVGLEGQVEDTWPGKEAEWGRQGWEDITNKIALEVEND